MCVWLQLGQNTSGYELQAMRVITMQCEALKVDYSSFVLSFISGTSGFGHFQRLNWLEDVICDA